MAPRTARTKRRRKQQMETFTVKMTLTENELNSIKNGEFTKVRKEFYSSVEFINFVLNKYPINKSFIDLIFDSISECSLDSINDKFNLLSYPKVIPSLNKFNLSCLLYQFTLKEYEHINEVYWKKYAKEIVEFFGTGNALTIAKASGIDGKLLKPFIAKPQDPSTYYKLSMLEMTTRCSNHKDLEIFLKSEELKKYWNIKEFVCGACLILENVSQKIKQLPVSKENADYILEYCCKKQSNYKWGLELYANVIGTNHLPSNILTDVLVHHDLDITQCMQLYKQGTYHITDNMYVTTDFILPFEISLQKLQPDFYLILEHNILEDAERDFQEWDKILSMQELFSVRLSKLQQKVKGII